MSKLDFLAERVPPAVWQYALAVVSVAVALGVTDWLEPYTTLRTPLFYIAIISSAWFGGMGPGLRPRRTLISFSLSEIWRSMSGMSAETERSASLAR